ncbi:MAG: polyprenyl synthetase family protein [Nitrospirae bacterium]|nr:MAG: polyprenyl synthetase family protein [Nitrospirota bacterium]
MSERVNTCAIAGMSDVWDCYRGELDAVEDQIRQNLDSKVALVNTVCAHILNSGGKRIRPLLLILSARAAGYTGRDDVLLAGLIEYIHTATLLHDDVVDHADLRRGRKTAGGLWGNQVAILVGDYLYCQAICRIVGFRSQDVNECLSEACRKMAEGELMQLSYRDDAAISEREYLKIVEHKTGALIAAACRMGAVVADADPALRGAAFRFGQAIGVAFQVADDTLDYAAPRESLGKSLGKDLGEGQVTLPLLHLRTHCTDRERARLAEVMEQKPNINGELAWVVSLMERYGSIDYAMTAARGFVQAAKAHLDPFEDSVHKRALHVVADYMVSRDH